MMRQNDEPKKAQLNEKLCPESFELCVPQESELFGYPWTTPGQWEEYIRELATDNELPLPDPVAEACYTCDCKPGWVLRRDLAVAHACKVHDQIHRQLLGLEKVSAVDVGFAIWERQTEFQNFLAIRIHVNQKLPPEQLVQAGLTSLSEPAFAAISDGVFRTVPRPVEDPTGSFARWEQLKRILNRELALGGKKGKLHRFRRYPISGVRSVDLSIFCPRELDEAQMLDTIRLCICGVPIDIINAHYNPSITHPGGDAARGVFADPPQSSNKLSNEEQLLIGRGRINPLVGGTSVSTITGQAGTLGTIVWDRTDATPCVLSNWHVLAGTPTAQVGQPTYQPALFDGGTEDDVVAHLKRWHLGEEGDAAIAELSGDRDYASGEILGLWHPISGYLPPRLNMEIRKWGRTTGFTQGFVDGIHLATNIDYGNGVVRFFSKQFHIAPLNAGDNVSRGGDSGSLVLASFRPIDQQRDFVRLCEWLRRCCDAQGGEDLCTDIKDEVEALKHECQSEDPSVELDICEPPRKALGEALEEALGEALDSLKPPCDDKNYEKLCNLLDTHLKALKGECSRIIPFANYRARVDDLFEKWYEKAKDTSTSACAICDRIMEDVEKLMKTPCSREFSSFRKTIDSTIQSFEKDCRAVLDREELCSNIRKQRDALRQEYGDLTHCAAFCTKVIARFEQWHKRLSGISTATDFYENLCKILHEASADSVRQDPSALFAYIKKCIEKKRAECTALEPAETEDQRPNDREPKPRANSFEAKFAKELGKICYDFEDSDKNWFRVLLERNLSAKDLLAAITDHSEKYLHQEEDKKSRNATRAYYAVGLIFAGDTPGSPFGEFAVASDIERLADKLRFSLRPVFEPRSSFRELRVRPQQPQREARALRSRTSLTPGTQSADPRGGGPQPDLEPSQSDSGAGGG